MNNKEVLITGGAGFLGINIAKRLKKLGYILYGIGHGEPEDHLYNFWYAGDVTFNNLGKLGFKSGSVIHCAGGSSVAQSVVEPLKDFNKTVNSSLELLEYIKVTNNKINVIYVSSAAVYGVQPDSLISEDAVKLPVSPYGFHKQLAEELFLYYEKAHNIKIVIMRLFSVYGPGLKKQLLWDAYNKLQSKSNPNVEFWGNGLETRDWIYVDDVVDLVLKLLTVENVSPIINVGSGISTTIYETISTMYNILQKEPLFYFNNKSRPGDPKYYLADISKAKSLAWEPKTSLCQGIQHYINWVSSNEQD